MSSQSGSSHSLPALLIISGIDLLLAALCAAIGMLVLLIGSASATGTAAAHDRQRMSDWSLLTVAPGKFQGHRVTCDGALAPEREIDGAASYTVRIDNGRQWHCEIELFQCRSGPKARLILMTPTVTQQLEAAKECTEQTVRFVADSSNLALAPDQVAAP